MAATDANHELFREMLWLGYDGMVTDNALEIIAQMPDGTRIEVQGTDWVCRYPITGVYDNCIWDTCPHRSAAKAFIAWKKGME